MFAAGNCAADTLSALLAAGAAISQRDRRGRNVLDYAPAASEVRRLLQVGLGWVAGWMWEGWDATGKYGAATPWPLPRLLTLTGLVSIFVLMLTWCLTTHHVTGPAG